MPVLYKKKGEGLYYADSAIEGKVVRFWLTDEGGNMLERAGIRPGVRFERDMLNKLICTGHAFAQSTERNQTTRFVNPVPEKKPPSCEGCSSLDDLHIVEMRCGERFSYILCADCRSKSLSSIDASIPLVVVTRAVLKQLIAMKKIINMSASVKSYKKLLDADHKTKMDACSKSPPAQFVMEEIIKANQNLC